MIPLKDRKIFHVQRRRDSNRQWDNTRWGSDGDYSEGYYWCGTWEQACGAITLAKLAYPWERYRIHFTIEGDVSEAPKPEPVKGKPDLYWRCEGDIAVKGPCLNQYCHYCNPAL